MAHHSDGRRLVVPIILVTCNTDRNILGTHRPTSRTTQTEKTKRKKSGFQADNRRSIQTSTQPFSMALAGRTLFVTGGSRGIGLSIALRSVWSAFFRRRCRRHRENRPSCRWAVVTFHLFSSFFIVCLCRVGFSVLHNCAVLWLHRCVVDT